MLVDFSGSEILSACKARPCAVCKSQLLNSVLSGVIQRKKWDKKCIKKKENERHKKQNEIGYKCLQTSPNPKIHNFMTGCFFSPLLYKHTLYFSLHSLCLKTMICFFKWKSYGGPLFIF